MLTALRRLASTWVAKLLFVLLVLSFAIWGIEDIVRNFGRETAVAYVAGKPIELEEAQMAARREIQRITRQLGPQFEADANIRRAVAAQALEGLIAERAVAAEAERMGVATPEEAIRAAVFAIPGLKGPDGQFSREFLIQFLRSNGLSEGQFLALVANDLARQQLLGAVRAGAAGPDALTRPLLQWQQERRVADIALLPLAGAPEPEAPDEAQLRRYHENNPDRFSAPEYREVTVAALTPEGLQGEIEVSDEEVAAAYEQRRGQFETPERRTLQQVLVPTEEAAKAIAEAWRAGEDWAAIETRAADAGGQALVLPPTDRGGLPVPELAEAAFATPEGQVTAPVQSPFGWHVFRVEDVEPATTRTLEQVRDELRRDVAHDRALDLAYERANQIEDRLAGGATLEEVAASTALTARTVTVDASGLGPDGEPVELPVPASARNEVLRAIFAAQQGDAPRLQEMGDAFVGIELRDVTPPALRPFETVEEQVRQAWTADARRRAQEERAAALLAAVRGGKPLPEAAREAGVNAARLGPFARDPQQGSPIPPELLAPLFEAKPGEATMVETRTGFAVAQLVDIVRADPDADPLGLGRVRTQVEQGMADDLQAQYQAAIRERADVTINRSLLEAVTGQ